MFGLSQVINYANTQTVVWEYSCVKVALFMEGGEPGEEVDRWRDSSSSANDNVGVWSGVLNEHNSIPRGIMSHEILNYDVTTIMI